MVNRDSNEVMHPIGFKVPGWMLEAIDEVQARRRMVTRSEAARLILVAGLDVLGVLEAESAA